jgi:3-oxoacyl-[acyl-carrier-protein] synthase II
VSPIGVGKKDFCRAIRNGQSGTKRISSFDASSYSTQVAGEIANFDPLDFVSLKAARRMDRSSQMIVAAALMAIDDARLQLTGDMSRYAVLTGTAVGGQAWAFHEYDVFREKGLKRINPFTAISTFPNASSAQISTLLGLKGISDTISSGCVSSTVALGYALDNIRAGRADVALLGGTEAPLDPGIFGAYCASRIMTSESLVPTSVPRPFDLRRDGIVLSEGAAVLVCEQLERALNRGARVYAEIGGWSHCSDPYNLMMMNPDGQQATAVMEAALADAEILPIEVDYVQAHASGSVADDRTEVLALRNVFGEHFESLPIVAMKSMLGHTQGACGAIEAVAAAICMYKQTIPRSINCENLDPACAANVNRFGPIHAPIRNALLNTFGFGGKLASIVLKALG